MKPSRLSPTYTVSFLVFPDSQMLFQETFTLVLLEILEVLHTSCDYQTTIPHFVQAKNYGVYSVAGCMVFYNT